MTQSIESNSVSCSDRSKLPPFSGLSSLIVGLVLAVLSMTSLAAESDTSEEAEAPRWFEIEVILFKLTSDEGLTNESWDKDVQLEMPEDVIDFLQPYTDLETTQDSENLNTENADSPQSSPELVAKPPVRQAADELSSDQSSETNQAAEDGFEEEAYVPLDSNLLALSREAKSIDKNSRYQLVAHLAWRQPVVGRNDSLPVRIAGGIDYQDTFDYQGHKKIDLMTSGANLDENRLNNFATLDDDATTNAQTTIEKDSELTNNTEITNNPELANDNSLASNPEQPKRTAIPWVPEIDGSVKVYIQRNYLHLDTKLYYRRPDKEEVDIISLNTNNTFANAGSYGFEQSLDDQGSAIGSHSIEAVNPTNENELSDEDSALETENESLVSDFSWQFDDDFLNQDSEKVYTERLFNYPLIQTRRLRSQELHYFDHPLIGMLVIIRAYENEFESQSSELETTE